MADRHGKACFGPTGRQENAEEWADAQEESNSADGKHQTDPKAQKRKKIFLQVGHHARRAHGPAQADKIVAKDDVLPQARALDGLTKFDIVHHFKAEIFIGANGFIR